MLDDLIMYGGLHHMNSDKRMTFVWTYT